MFKTNARTKTASALTASGDRLRLETPQFMAQCLTDRVPYVMPDPAGGYVLIAEYGDPCPEPKVEEKGTGCGCGDGCADPGKCNKPKNCEQKKQVSRCEQPNRAGLERDDEDRLLRYEIAKYSGYEADGVTLILTQRGVEGTIKQDWPVNTLVMQVMTGAELKDVYNSINGVKSFLDSLGCILAVPRNPDGACGGWNVGEWACFGGQFYRSKENGNCTTAPGAKWDCGIDLFDLLDLYCNGLVDCAGDKIRWTDTLVACRNMGDGLVWNPATKKWDVKQVRVVAIDDSGTQTTITLSDGTVISGPEIDQDDYVVNYTTAKNAAGDTVLTLTMKNGATHSVTLPAAVAAQDNYVTGLTIGANGLVTATRNNGLPALTAQIQFPVPTEMVFPMAGYRGAYGAPTTDPVFTASNAKLYFSQFINQSGGFNDTLGTTDIVIPKTGWYRFDHRCTARYTSTTPPAKCSTAVKKNGTTLAVLAVNFGTNFFPFAASGDQQEAEKSMYHHCMEGDVITVETGVMDAGAEIIGETLLIKWESL